MDIWKILSNIVSNAELADFTSGDVNDRNVEKIVWLCLFVELQLLSAIEMAYRNRKKALLVLISLSFVAACYLRQGTGTYIFEYLSQKSTV